jgi:hypothetical protein
MARVGSNISAVIINVSTLIYFLKYGKWETGSKTGIRKKVEK